MADLSLWVGHLCVMFVMADRPPLHHKRHHNMTQRWPIGHDKSGHDKGGSTPKVIKKPQPTPNT